MAIASVIYCFKNNLVKKTNGKMNKKMPTHQSNMNRIILRNWANGVFSGVEDTIFYLKLLLSECKNRIGVKV